jgi:hypothetical protein
MSILSSLQNAILGLTRQIGQVARNLPIPRGSLLGGDLGRLLSAFSTPTGRRSRSRRAFRARSRVFEAGVGQLGAGIGRLFNPNPTIGSVGSGLSQYAGGLGLIAGAFVGGPAGAAIASVTGILSTLSATAFEVNQKLREFGKGLLDANLKFADFSPSMAMVKMQEFIDNMALSIRKGEALAPSASALQKSRQLYEKEINEPIETGLQKLYNQWMTDYFNETVTTKKALFNMMEGKNASTPPIKPAPEVKLDEYEKFIKLHGRPPRFGEIQ